MNQPHRSRLLDLREWVDPLNFLVIVLVVLGAAVFVVGYTLPSTLLQALGAITFGAGLSALIGVLTGRQAIQQQSAKDANLTRKRETYGPLYTEVKFVSAVFASAEAGTAPAPQWIDNGEVVNRAGTVFLSPLQSVPTLKCWPEFRQNYLYTDFRPETQALLDEIHTLATTYNNAAEAVRERANRTLGRHIDDAITRLQQSADYKQWQEKQAAKKPMPVPISHEQKSEQDWYGYIEYQVAMVSSLPDITPGQQLAAEWLGRWPDPLPSQVLGWILAKPTDQDHKAAEYVWSNYPANRMTNPPPPSWWIDAIFEGAWLELRKAAETRQAIDVGEALFKHVQKAERLLLDGLRRIQERFEGGEPLV